MYIEHNAFKNCINLKEIHFEKCDKAINTNITDEFLNVKIIVRDKLCLDFKIEDKSNFDKIVPYSKFILNKISNIPSSNIIISIIYLMNVINYINNTKIINIIQIIIQQLILKFNIKHYKIKYIDFLLKKIQELKNEK